MQPINYGSLPKHTRNDTWEGITSIGPILLNNAQPASALASCEMYFRDGIGTLGHKLSSAPGAGEGTITISDVDTWEITIPAQALTLTAGEWEWDLETVDAAGSRRTVLKGKITITQDVTYD